MSSSSSTKRTSQSALQPSIQIAAQRLEYLYRRRSTGVRKKSRYQAFMYWFESDKSSIETLSKTTTLRDVSITARRLLLPPSSSSSCKLHGDNEVNDSKEVLLQWLDTDKTKEKYTTPKRALQRNGPYGSSSRSTTSSSNNTNSRFNNNSSSVPIETKSYQLVESKHDIEVWLFIIAIYILWKKESNCTEALTLCSRAIGVNTSHMDNILTRSPKSQLEKEENADRVSSLKELNKILQEYESTLAQQCVSSYLDKDSNDDDGADEKKDDLSGIDTHFDHKDKMNNLQRRMEYNKKRLESLNTSMDFKANMINFNLIDVNCSKNEIERDESDEEKSISSFVSVDDTEKIVTMSNFLYPHLVYHPYFNSHC